MKGQAGQVSQLRTKWLPNVVCYLPLGSGGYLGAKGNQFLVLINILIFCLYDYSLADLVRKKIKGYFAWTFLQIDVNPEHAEANNRSRQTSFIL